MILAESRLPVVLETMVQNVWLVAFAFLFISMVFPWFLLPLLVLSFLYYYISKIFRCVCEIKDPSVSPVVFACLKYKYW